MGVTVVRVRLADDRCGEYVHAQRLIRLCASLTRREARCTLAHELAHAHYGDVGTHWRTERRARRTAAGWLIEQAAYERAAAMFEGEPRMIANELDVTLEVLEDYAALVLGVAA
jgi:Zn-dependent peptidase ImmA (M78 family)